MVIDQKVNLWNLKEEGITEERTVPDGVLVGHNRKVMHIRFHPAADLTVATAEFKETIKIWYSIPFTLLNLNLIPGM
jgi:hypothetical protein